MVIEAYVFCLECGKVQGGPYDLREQRVKREKMEQRGCEGCGYRHFYHYLSFHLKSVRKH